MILLRYIAPLLFLPILLTGPSCSDPQPAANWSPKPIYKDPCSDPQAEAYWARSAIYNQANDLAQKLQTAGIHIRCMRSSKEEHLFDGQAGAAWVKSDQGVFEVWFLPEADSFSGLQVIEKPTSDGRFLYSFEGRPHIKTIFDSSRRMLFIKQRNLLFETEDDSKLAARINNAFGGR